MSCAKVLKGSLATTVLDLVLFFSIAATPLCPEKNCSSYMEELCRDFPTVNEGQVELSPPDEWRKYDVNLDGRFDEGDINSLIDEGWPDIQFDLNEDGKKDFDDVLSLFIRLTVMDRSCNRAVDDEDYAEIEPVQIPEVPDAGTIRSIVITAVMQARATLPPDIEDQAFRSVPAGKILSIDERAYVYQVAGMSGLAQNNLEAAIWGFGKAFQTNERSAGALGSLAFCLSANDQDNEALLLLAFAHDLFPASAPTATSFGWIFARHGQNDLALEYFRDAISYAPQIGQYYMNLGVIMMRKGMKREAWESFRKAAELDPGDIRKALFWYSTKPPDIPPVKKKFDPEEFKKAREAEIREMEDLGYSEEGLPEPWDMMSPCNHATLVAEILERKHDSRMMEIAIQIANEAAKKIDDLAKGFWPQWKNINEDWARYVEGVPIIYNAGLAISTNAEIEAGHENASLIREMGAELLGYSSYFMDCALQEAKAQSEMAAKQWKNLPIPAQSLAQLKSEAYKDALQDAIRHCYKSQIDLAYRWLSYESRPYGLPTHTVETPHADGFMYLFMVIPLECFNIEGYCPDGEGDDRERPEMPADFTIGIDLWIVSFEWNLDTDEIELNVGQGIIVGVTWTPETGFGFQIGAGIDGGIGPVGATAAVYAKFDEGRCTVQGELGGHIGKGPLSLGAEMIPFQAAFEL